MTTTLGILVVAVSRADYAQVLKVDILRDILQHMTNLLLVNSRILPSLGARTLDLGQTA
jgi:hypothetical protein